MPFMSYRVEGFVKVHLILAILAGCFLIFCAGKIDQFLQSFLALAWYFTEKKFSLLVAVRTLVFYNLGSVILAGFIEFVVW